MQHNLLYGGVALNCEYPVLFHNTESGKVSLRKTGMFYYLTCDCQLPSTGKYCLYLGGLDTERSLGFLTKNEQYHSLRIHIACKNLSLEGNQFFVKEKQLRDQMEKVCLAPEKAVEHLSNLAKAHLEMIDGMYYLSFRTN